jgi:hypothetical protein
MHPSLESCIGNRVELVMEDGPPWYGARFEGELARPPAAAPEGSVKLTHKYAGDVILLPFQVRTVRRAKAQK